MDPIKILRDRAAEKRDFAIAQARRVYQRDLAAIDALDKSLPPQVVPEPTATSNATNTVALIQSLIPTDRGFTVTDMIGWLESAQPGQQFYEPTVRTYVSRLARRGVIRKLHKSSRGYTRWAATEAFKQNGLVETKSLADLVEDALRQADGPMRVSEIALALREQGYRPDAKPVTLSRAAGDALRRHPGRFQRGKDGRWATTTATVHLP